MHALLREKRKIIKSGREEIANPGCCIAAAAAAAAAPAPFDDDDVKKGGKTSPPPLFGPPQVSPPQRWRRRRSDECSLQPQQDPPNEGGTERRQLHARAHTLTADSRMLLAEQKLALAPPLFMLQHSNAFMQPNCNNSGGEEKRQKMIRLPLCRCAEER